MNKKVMTAMSGGVDSSAAALLLMQQGYDICGVTLSLFESDQVQVAHHGNNGGSDKRIYEMVADKCSVIWYPNCVTQSALDRALRGDWGCNFSAAFKNPNCKLMIFNGAVYGEYPMLNVTLKITATGPLYDDLYNPVNGEDVEAKAEPWPAVDVQAYRIAVGK